MKNILTYICFLFILVFIIGCNKTAETPEPKDDKVTNLLVGTRTSSKNLHLDKIFVYKIEPPVTYAQKSFFKTQVAYPSNSIPTNPNIENFRNLEGLIGTWKLIGNGGDLLTETLIDSSGLYNKSTYLINRISSITLDIENTVNYKTVREVYTGN